jgi:hypothetical protein
MPAVGDIDASYPTSLEQENKIKLLEPFKGAKKHHRMQCIVCNHEWLATPISKRHTYIKYNVGGCPNCNNSRKEAHKKHIQQGHIDQMVSRGVIILDDFTALRTTKHKLRFKNIVCGHEFETYPGNVIEKKTTCTVCGKVNRTSTVTQWSKANSKKWRETATEWQKYKADVSALTAQTYRKYKKQINPNNLPRGKAGVIGAYHLDHIVPKRFCFENYIPPEICADKSNLQMIGWRENVGSRNHLKGTIPPLFMQYLSLHDRMKSYRDVLTVGDYKQFYKIEDIVVDLYSEENNHAIVFIPLDRSQANSKTALMILNTLSDKKIVPTIIFEDELTNIPLIQSKLVHKARRNNTPRVHARKCEICLVVNKNKKSLFLNTYHNQGNDNSQIAYGAYYNNELVAMMTFSPPRAGIGVHTNKQKGTYELVRFATDTMFRVPGVASKLLKHFQRNHSWSEIYSYADRRWSDGNLYEKIGFDLVKTNPPDYFYVVDGKRKHRWNYRKDILKETLSNYDSKLTEYQNMQNAGYYRVWDCGTLKYALKNV